MMHSNRSWDWSSEETSHGWQLALTNETRRVSSKSRMMLADHFLRTFPDLIATNVVDDRKVALEKADFLVRASRIANNKARELGWIS